MKYFNEKHREPKAPVMKKPLLRAIFGYAIAFGQILILPFYPKNKIKKEEE